MQNFTVSRDDAPDLRFDGELVASVRTSPDRAAGSDWSGSNGRWRELALYKTKAGAFVVERADRTQHDGERDRRSAAACADHAQVIEFVGHTRLGKALLVQAGIETADWID